jgi:YD repeat-containing protein
MANSEGRGFTYNAVGEVLSELDAEANLIEMQYDRLGRLEERRANGELVGAWHFDNPDPNKGPGLLDYEDSLFQPDDTRLQKHYFGTGFVTKNDACPTKTGKSGVNRCRRCECSLESEPMNGVALSRFYD